MKDLSYTSKGLWTSFVPNTSAGEDAWREMANNGGATVLTIHLKSVLHQLNKAGYTYEKAKPAKLKVDKLLKELGL